MLTSFLERLDEIERFESDGSVDSEVIGLMEQVALLSGGLRILVERYGDSSSAIIVRSLSFLLAVGASSPMVESPDLIFSLIDRIQQDDESTLINCLTTIERQLIHDVSWEIPLQIPPTFYPFLVRCLEHSVFVQRSAISVISHMYQDGLLTQVFDANKLAKLQHKLLELMSLNDPLLKAEIESLQSFLEDEQT